MIVNTFAGLLDVNMDDCWIRNHTIHGDIYEQHIIMGPCKKFIESAKYVIDVGANNGNHTIAYSYINPNCTIYSFEPQNNMFKYLESSVKLNKLSNVNLYNVCLGHDNCKTTLRSPTDENLGGIGIGSGGEEVDMITLDSLNLPGCDYIKIDVEGAEPLVIQGASQTISKFKPVIMFEHNGSSIDFFKTTSVFIELTKLGYDRFFYLDWDNYLAVHKSKLDVTVDPCLVPKFR